uniref:CSON000072 protein n=1 Tax=Culicoides sonorensis TaxID=179676 RepID=A0A336LPC9_CULSO
MNGNTKFQIFCFLCITVSLLVQTITAGDELPVDFDADLVFTKPQKPVLRHLSEPEQAEYKDFLQYLYRYDTKKRIL